MERKSSNPCPANAQADMPSLRYQVIAFHSFENGFDEKTDHRRLETASKAAKGYVGGMMATEEFMYEGAAVYDRLKHSYVRIYGNFPDHNAISQVKALVPSIREAPDSDSRWQAFLEQPGAAYAILQMKVNDTARLFSRSLESLNRDNLTLSFVHYTVVYGDELPEFTNLATMLEGLFSKFNSNPPADFCGHSMCVSDVIAIKVNGVVSFHYCDFIGFRELPSSFLTENCQTWQDPEADAFTAQDWKSAFARYVANDLDAAEPEYVRDVLFDICGLSEEAIKSLGFECLIDEVVGL